MTFFSSTSAPFSKHGKPISDELLCLVMIQSKIDYGTRCRYGFATKEYEANLDMTDEELYNIACRLAKEARWGFGEKIAGHLVGSFPHERIPNDKTSLYMTSSSNSRLSTSRQKRHWILEIHLVNRAREVRAFYELK
jgi:hypothetical protein